MPSENGSPLVPDVPVGLGSKVGIGSGVLVAFVGAVFAFADGDHSEETITALIVGGALILSVVWGRMLQAIAQIKAAQPKVIALAAPAGELPSGDGPLTEGDMADHDRAIEGDGYDRPYDQDAEARQIEDAEPSA